MFSYSDSLGMPSWARWTNRNNRLGIGGTDLTQLAPCQGCKVHAGRANEAQILQRTPRGTEIENRLPKPLSVSLRDTYRSKTSLTWTSTVQFLVRAPSSRRTITSFNSTSRLRVLVRLQRCITRCPGELPVVQRRWARLELPS